MFVAFEQLEKIDFLYCGVQDGEYALMSFNGILPLKLVRFIFRLAFSLKNFD